MPRSRAEKGCIDYHFHVGADDPNLFYFYENWTTRADLDVHLNLPYQKEWFGQARRVPGQARRAAPSSRCSATTTRIDGERAMLARLREEVLEANLEIVRRGLVLYTFGNVSGISREDGLVVIKPSGVDYDRLTPGEMVVTDLDGRVQCREPQALGRSCHPSRALSRLSGHWRRRPHPFGIRHDLRAGQARRAGSGHDPCRLFPRADPGDAGADRGGDRGRLCRQYRARDRRELRRPGSAGGSGGAGRLARTRSPGAGRRPTRSTMRWCSRPSPRWRSTR